MKRQRLTKKFRKIAITFLFLDVKMPEEQRERLEKLLALLDPDLYNDVYVPFRDGDMSLHQIVFELKKKRRDRLLQLSDETCPTLTQKLERLKKYNLSEAAEILEVPRQTVYYWIKKGWVIPKRDLRQYPFFTVFEIEKMIKWRDKVKLNKLHRKISKNRRFVQHSLTN